MWASLHFFPASSFRPQGAFPTSKAREKRPGDEVDLVAKGRTTTYALSRDSGSSSGYRYPPFEQLVKYKVKYRARGNAGSGVACVQTSPISYVARGKGTSLFRNKGNRRRLHAGKIRSGESKTRGTVKIVVASPLAFWFGRD